MCEYEDRYDDLMDCYDTLESELAAVTQERDSLLSIIESPLTVLEIMQEAEESRLKMEYERGGMHEAMMKHQIAEDELRNAKIILDSKIRKRLSGLPDIFIDNVKLMKERGYDKSTIDHIVDYHSIFWEGKF